MGMYEKAFNKFRKEEGSIRINLPWQEEDRQGGKNGETILLQDTMPGFISQLPYAVSNEFQIIVENIRTAATERSMKVIGISAPIPKQGVSTCLAVVSAMMAWGKIHTANGKNGSKVYQPFKRAKTNLPVLIIDTQIRNPVLHNIFSIRPRKGIVHYLSEDHENYNSIIHDTEIQSLKMTPCGVLRNFQYSGTIIDNFRLLLDELKEQYEHIFLDIPALLRYADGIALSKLCDGMLLVVKANETRFEVIKQANYLLEQNSIPVIGGILNQRQFHIPDWLYHRL